MTEVKSHTHPFRTAAAWQAECMFGNSINAEAFGVGISEPY